MAQANEPLFQTIGWKHLMKVFISWSGDHARKVAELLKKHIERVNQRVYVDRDCFDPTSFATL